MDWLLIVLAQTSMSSSGRSCSRRLKRREVSCNSTAVRSSSHACHLGERTLQQDEVHQLVGLVCRGNMPRHP